MSWGATMLAVTLAALRSVGPSRRKACVVVRGVEVPYVDIAFRFGIHGMVLGCWEQDEWLWWSLYGAGVDATIYNTSGMAIMGGTIRAISIEHRGQGLINVHVRVDTTTREIVERHHP